MIRINLARSHHAWDLAEKEGKVQELIQLAINGNAVSSREMFDELVCELRDEEGDSEATDHLEVWLEEAEALFEEQMITPEEDTDFGPENEAMVLLQMAKSNAKSGVGGRHPVLSTPNLIVWNKSGQHQSDGAVKSSNLVVRFSGIDLDKSRPDGPCVRWRAGQVHVAGLGEWHDESVKKQNTNIERLWFLDCKWLIDNACLREARDFFRVAIRTREAEIARSRAGEGPPHVPLPREPFLGLQVHEVEHFARLLDAALHAQERLLPGELSTLADVLAVKVRANEVLAMMHIVEGRAEDCLEGTHNMCLHFDDVGRTKGSASRDASAPPNTQAEEVGFHNRDQKHAGKRFWSRARMDAVNTFQYVNTQRYISFESFQRPLPGSGQGDRAMFRALRYAAFVKNIDSYFVLTKMFDAFLRLKNAGLEVRRELGVFADSPDLLSETDTDDEPWFVTSIEPKLALNLHMPICVDGEQHSTTNLYVVWNEWLAASREVWKLFTDGVPSDWLLHAQESDATWQHHTVPTVGAVARVLRRHAEHAESGGNAKYLPALSANPEPALPVFQNRGREVTLYAPQGYPDSFRCGEASTPRFAALRVCYASNGQPQWSGLADGEQPNSVMPAHRMESEQSLVNECLQRKTACYVLEHKANVAREDAMYKMTGSEEGKTTAFSVCVDAYTLRHPSIDRPAAVRIVEISWFEDFCDGVSRKLFVDNSLASSVAPFNFVGEETAMDVSDLDSLESLVRNMRCYAYADWKFSDEEQLTRLEQELRSIKAKCTEAVAVRAGDESQETRVWRAFEVFLEETVKEDAEEYGRRFMEHLITNAHLQALKECLATAKFESDEAQKLFCSFSPGEQEGTVYWWCREAAGIQAFWAKLRVDRLQAQIGEPGSSAHGARRRAAAQRGVRIGQGVRAQAQRACNRIRPAAVRRTNKQLNENPRNMQLGVSRNDPRGDPRKRQIVGQLQRAHETCASIGKDQAFLRAAEECMRQLRYNVFLGPLPGTRLSAYCITYLDSLCARFTRLFCGAAMIGDRRRSANRRWQGFALNPRVDASTRCLLTAQQEAVLDIAGLLHASPDAMQSAVKLHELQHFALGEQIAADFAARQKCRALVAEVRALRKASTSMHLKLCSRTTREQHAIMLGEEDAAVQQQQMPSEGVGDDADDDMLDYADTTDRPKPQMLALAKRVEKQRVGKAYVLMPREQRDEHENVYITSLPQLLDVRLLFSSAVQRGVLAHIDAKMGQAEARIRSEAALAEQRGTIDLAQRKATLAAWEREYAAWCRVHGAAVEAEGSDARLNNVSMPLLGRVAPRARDLLSVFFATRMPRQFRMLNLFGMLAEVYQRGFMTHAHLDALWMRVQKVICNIHPRTRLVFDKFVAGAHEVSTWHISVARKRDSAIRVLKMAEEKRRRVNKTIASGFFADEAMTVVAHWRLPKIYIAYRNGLEAAVLKYGTRTTLNIYSIVQAIVTVTDPWNMALQAPLDECEYAFSPPDIRELCPDAYPKVGEYVSGALLDPANPRLAALHDDAYGDVEELPAKRQQLEDQLCVMAMRLAIAKADAKYGVSMSGGEAPANDHRLAGCVSQLRDAVIVARQDPHEHKSLLDTIKHARIRNAIDARTAREELSALNEARSTSVAKSHTIMPAHVSSVLNACKHGNSCKPERGMRSFLALETAHRNNVCAQDFALVRLVPQRDKFGRPPAQNVKCEPRRGAPEDEAAEAALASRGFEPNNVYESQILEEKRRLSSSADVDVCAADELLPSVKEFRRDTARFEPLSSRALYGGASFGDVDSKLLFDGGEATEPPRFDDVYGIPPAEALRAAPASMPPILATEPLKPVVVPPETHQYVMTTKQKPPSVAALRLAEEKRCLEALASKAPSGVHHLAWRRLPLEARVEIYKNGNGDTPLRWVNDSTRQDHQDEASVEHKTFPDHGEWIALDAAAPKANLVQVDSCGTVRPASTLPCNSAAWEFRVPSGFWRRALRHGWFRVVEVEGPSKYALRTNPDNTGVHVVHVAKPGPAPTAPTGRAKAAVRHAYDDAMQKWSATCAAYAQFKECELRSKLTQENLDGWLKVYPTGYAVTTGHGNDVGLLAQDRSRRERAYNYASEAARAAVSAQNAPSPSSGKRVAGSDDVSAVSSDSEESVHESEASCSSEDEEQESTDIRASTHHEETAQPADTASSDNASLLLQRLLVEGGTDAEIEAALFA